VNIWVSILNILPLEISCWAENFKVHFDNRTGEYVPHPGVYVEPVDFGGVGGITFLNPALKKRTAYLAPLVQYLQEAGYISGTDLVGAPFDFRLAGVDQVMKNGQYAALKQLVEKTVVKTGKKAHILGHSLGAPYVSRFLADFVTRAWKAKYVASFISFGGPFAGASPAITGSVSDVGWRIPGIDPHLFGGVVHSFASLSWMLPSAAFDPRTPLVHTNKRTYYLNDFADFFREAGAHTVANMYERTLASSSLNHPPGVISHIFYGFNVSTPLTYSYLGQKDFTSPPKLIQESDGDGVVNMDSLMACRHWESQQTQPLFYYPLFNVSHLEMVWNPQVWAQLLDIIAD